MAQLSDKPVAVGQVKVSGRGVRGEVFEGVEASARSRARGTFDPLEKALQEAGGLSVIAAVTLDVSSTERGISRDGGEAVAFDETPAVHIEGPELAPGDYAQLAIVEEDGLYRFVRANEHRRNEFDIPVEPGGPGAQRGLFQKVGQMAVRIIGVAVAKKAVAKATELLVRKIEDAKRPHRLRPFLPGSFSSPTASELDLSKMAGGPTLLLIHGTNSSSHSGFSFDSAYVAALHDRYDGRVFAFDHPTLSYSPRANAEWLANQLEGVTLGNVDIIAHSRGGLVARSLLEQVRPSNLEVRSLLFMATPNGGTPIADPEHLGDFISTITNLMRFLPDNVVTDTIAIGLEIMKDWVLDAAFPAMEGVAAQNPRSPALEALNAVGPTGETTYRAIATDFEPRSDHGAWRRARDLAMDVIFRGVHNDLVVPTRSAYAPCDLFHVESDARLVLNSSFGIEHSSFWKHELVLNRLDQWLDPNVPILEATPVAAQLTDPAAEAETALRSNDFSGFARATSLLSSDQAKLVAETLGGPLATPLREGRSSEGSVIVIPGIMGSTLDVDGREVWLSMWQLMRGRFAHLEVNGAGRTVEATGLVRQYGPLVSHLDRSWDVFTLPYDWRRDLEEAADHLADCIQRAEVGLGNQTVHIVAHSMGGLVARTFIARYPELWKKAGGRLIQLGTPNWGSFAIPAAFLGEEFLVQALAFADIFHSKDEIVATVASFPGAYQMLPSPDRTLPDGQNDHARIYEDTVWGDHPIRQDLLDEARAFQDLIRPVVDPDRFIYIAGDGHRTPYRLRVDRPGHFSLGVTERGDGRVPHDFGYEDLDIPTYFVDANHGDLAADDEVLGALDELLRSGATDLRTSPSTRRAAQDEPIEWIPVEELELRLGNSTTFTARGEGGAADLVRAQSVVQDAAKLYIGGGDPAEVGAHPLQVTVVHGSLEQTEFPVAGGWYKGLPIDGALRFMDWRLGGVLERHKDLDLYPEEDGSAIYVASPSTRPTGAIILGLGEFGALTPTLLSRAMTEGTVRYVLDELRNSNGARLRLGVATVLAGAPGRYGLGIESSMLALIDGVARAAARLADVATVDRLEIIELYGGLAEQAATMLNSIPDLPVAAALDVPIVATKTLEVRAGGRAGIGDPDESGPAWPRFVLEFDRPSSNTGNASSGAAEVTSESQEGRGPASEDTPQSRPRELTYVRLGRRAQADHLRVQVNEEAVRRHVTSAVGSRDPSAQTNNTLYELLFPNQAKLELEDLDNLHILVDKTTAWIPWEVLAGRDARHELKPLALRTGVLRQLYQKDHDTSPRMPTPTGMHALVIGDPPGGDGFPRLSGAQQEAREVAQILRDGSGRRHPYEVTEVVFGPDAELHGEQGADIRNAFFSHPYRIIHIAAHGVYDPSDGGPQNPLEAGVVIGEHDRLSAIDFIQRSTTPDLVFLNCCHIGRIGDYGETQAAIHGRFADFAASVAVALMEHGVKAVVAAGWAVADHAARAFATTLYSQMMGGAAYGEAVRKARWSAHQTDGGRSNTWGAYQCYGDPGFTFFGTTQRGSARKQSVSPDHLATTIRAKATIAGLVDIDDAKSLADDLVQLDRDEIPTFNTVAVLEALGDAYRDLGRFDHAVDAYRRAIDHDDACASLRTYEQLANVEARLAAVRHRGEDDEDNPRVTDTSASLFREAERRLRWLNNQVKETAERQALLGSLYKKRAASRSTDRMADAARALEAYERAAELSKTPDSDEYKVYHASLAIQLAGLVELDGERQAHFAAMLEQLERQAEASVGGPGTYFARAARTDVRACGASFRRQLDQASVRDKIVEGYREQFAVRASARQRLSVIHNYEDLAVLLGDHPERSNESAGALDIATRLAEPS